VSYNSHDIILPDNIAGYLADCTGLFVSQDQRESEGFSDLCCPWALHAL